MELNTKVIDVYDLIDKHLHISCHVTFWEHKFSNSILNKRRKEKKFFNSMESFPPYSSPIFINVSIDLISNFITLDVGTMISLGDSTMVGPNTTNLPANSFTAPPKSKMFVPCLSKRVRELNSYHCYKVLEPYSFREAHIDPLWQKVMSEELDAFTKTHT
jgi:hypothetical protein